MRLTRLMPLIRPPRMKEADKVADANAYEADAEADDANRAIVANETKEANESMIQQGHQVDEAVVVDNVNGVLDNQFADLEKLDEAN